jgi:adenylate cyclase, class 2
VTGTNVMLVNVEIKAKCANHDRARAFLLARDALPVGRDHQTDTYFRVGRGRLKLREGDVENALIFYEREDLPGPKESRVMLFPTVPGTPLKALLAGALGVWAVVDKRREIYLIDNVKFNLDTVEGLGAFVEIEASGAAESAGLELFTQCNTYLEDLGIEEEDLVTVSYSDLLAD